MLLLWNEKRHPAVNPRVSPSPAFSFGKERAMLILRGSLTVALALALATAVVAAPNRSLSARHRTNRYTIEGTVVRVHHHRSPRSAGWIEVRRPQHHHSAGRSGTSAVAAAGRNRSGSRSHVVKVPVNSSTRFQRRGRSVNGNAIASTRTARISFHALRTGERVRIIPGSSRRHAARVVEIMPNSSIRCGIAAPPLPQTGRTTVGVTDTTETPSSAVPSCLVPAGRNPQGRSAVT